MPRSKKGCGRGMSRAQQKHRKKRIESAQQNGRLDMLHEQKMKKQQDIYRAQQSYGDKIFQENIETKS